MDSLARRVCALALPTFGILFSGFAPAADSELSIVQVVSPDAEASSPYPATGYPAPFKPDLGSAHSAGEPNLDSAVGSELKIVRSESNSSSDAQYRFRLSQSAAQSAAAELKSNVHDLVPSSRPVAKRQPQPALQQHTLQQHTAPTPPVLITKMALLPKPATSSQATRPKQAAKRSDTVSMGDGIHVSLPDAAPQAPVLVARAAKAPKQAKRQDFYTQNATKAARQPAFPRVTTHAQPGPSMVDQLINELSVESKAADLTTATASGRPIYVAGFTPRKKEQTKDVEVTNSVGELFGGVDLTQDPMPIVAAANQVASRPVSKASPFQTPVFAPSPVRARGLAQQQPRTVTPPHMPVRVPASVPVRVPASPPVANVPRGTASRAVAPRVTQVSERMPVAPRPVSAPRAQQPTSRQSAVMSPLLAAAMRSPHGISPDRHALPAVSGPLAKRLTENDKIRAETVLQEGFELVQRRAYFSARAKFIQVLRIVARSLDEQSQTTRHEVALRTALQAYKEAGGFFPDASHADDDVNLFVIVGGHVTPVAQDIPADQLTARNCLKRYMAFAEDRFSMALGEEPLASKALYGLGRMEATTDTSTSHSDQVRTKRSMVMFRSALLVDSTNYAAANEFGVLLAQYGHYKQAIDALRHCVRISPEPTAWKNLASIHQKLGQADQARLAHAEATRSPGNGIPFVAQQPQMQWVDANTFASMPQTAGGTQFATRPSQMAAQAPAAKRVQTAQKPSKSWLPWKK